MNKDDYKKIGNIDVVIKKTFMDKVYEYIGAGFILLVLWGVIGAVSH
jgi:hypothetical protein